MESGIPDPGASDRATNRPEFYQELRKHNERRALVARLLRTQRERHPRIERVIQAQRQRTSRHST